MKQAVSDIITATRNATPEDLIRYTLDRFKGRIGLATSLGAEDQVLTDMICNIAPDTLIFTLDTGRLPQETYHLIDKTRMKYNIAIKILFPDSELVTKMVTEKGPNLFYDSVENRKRCCYVRKVEPLKKQLAQLDAWITGLRAEQSVTREDLEPVGWDEQFELIKICPLAHWSEEDVWNYIREHNVPYNKLHDQGYPSIGCAPCTRAVQPGENIRAGRWWWENPENKECGLHINKD